MKASKLAASYVDSRSSDFWGHLAKIRGTAKNPSSSVNGISDNNKGVADLFTDYYHEICNFVGFDEEEMQVLYDNVCEKVSCCASTDHRYRINHASVSHSIHKLKGEKKSDFILNGTDRICQHLSKLFSLMLSHCIAPSSFCMSTMIPIPKESGLMGNIKNYRGIALSSLLSKLFDTCTISSKFDRLQSNLIL